MNNRSSLGSFYYIALYFLELKINEEIIIAAKYTNGIKIDIKVALIKNFR